MTVIAIASVGSQGVVLRSGQLARVLVERFDNTVVRLISRTAWIDEDLVYIKVVNACS